MAWLLIRAFSDNKPAAWQIGDIVEVRPDDFSGWGKKEGPPLFYRIKINNLDYSRAKSLLENADDEIDGDKILPNGRNIIRRRVRKYRINTASLASNIRNRLFAGEDVAVSYNSIRQHIKDNMDQEAPQIGG